MENRKGEGICSDVYQHRKEGDESDIWKNRKGEGISSQ